MLRQLVCSCSPTGEQLRAKEAERGLLATNSAKVAFDPNPTMLSEGASKSSLLEVAATGQKSSTAIRLYEGQLSSRSARSDTASSCPSLVSNTNCADNLENFAQEQLEGAFQAIKHAELVLKQHSSNSSTNFTVLEELEQEENSVFNTSQQSILSMRSECSIKSELSDTDLIVEIEIFECERFFPFVGWSKRLLPSDPGSFTDRSGRAVDKSIVSIPKVPATRCPRGAKQYTWTWVNPEWQVDPLWRYGTDFSSFSETRQGGAWSRTCFVRRRQWTRSCCAVEDPIFDKQKHHGAVSAALGNRRSSFGSATSGSSRKTTRRTVMMQSSALPTTPDRFSASQPHEVAKEDIDTDPFDCLELLREQVVDYKNALTQYSQSTILRQNEEIKRLKKDLAIARRRSQSAFKTAANAMTAQNDGHSEPSKQQAGMLTEEGEKRPAQAESADASASESNLRSQPQGDTRPDQVKSQAKIVKELNRQFSDNSIDIDEYALALAGLTDDIGQASTPEPVEPVALEAAVAAAASE